MKKLVVLGALLVSGLSFGQAQGNDDCKDIKVKVDEYVNKTSTLSPFSENVAFMNIKTDADEIKGVRLTTIGYSASYSGKGVFILFADGRKIIKEEQKIDIKYNDSSTYRYTALLVLTPEEIEIFKTTEIKSFKLYIYDGIVNKSIKIKNYANCIWK